jgi:excisionase family DNA binding protein
MKNTIDTSDLMNYTDAAKLGGISRQTLYKWIRLGKLTPVKINGGQLINKADIMRLKLEREIKL